MGTFIEETLMSLGDFEADLDWDPDVLAAARFGRTWRLWWNERLLFAGPITRRPRHSDDGITLAGRSHEFWLGLDEDGPIITDREFVSGTNKLSNGDFPDDLGLLYWRLKENTVWQPPSLGVVTTNASAIFFDDELEYDATFEADPGMEFEVGGTVNRDYGDTGRIRLRLVYSGKFDPPNLLTSFVDWSYHDTLDPEVDITDPAITLGPLVQRQIVPNGDFENTGLTDWTASGTVGATGSQQHSGSWGAQYHMSDDGGAGALLDSQPAAVLPSQRFRFDGWTTIQGTPVTSDTVGGNVCSIQLGDYTDFQVVDTFALTWELLRSGWQKVSKEFDVPSPEAGVTDLSLWVDLIFFGITGETGLYHDWDDVSLTRLTGNRGYVYSPFIDVTPERSYTGKLKVTIGAGMTSGSLKVLAYYSADSRSPVIQDVGSLDSVDQPGTEFEKIVEFRLQPPSGYDRVQLEIQAHDVYGGSYTIEPIGLWDDDTSTVVFDDKSPETATDEVRTISAVAPAGTERVGMMVVAENGANGWGVSAVSLKRVGAATSNTDDVIDVLLRNPNTDDYLVGAGDIADFGVVPYDLRYRNMTNRTILKQFSRAVMQPPCEWRVNPDCTLDWGRDLFVDRTTFILTPSDRELLEVPDVEDSAEDAVQTVKVIGAEMRPVGGLKTNIEATATNDPAGKVDYFGNPWDRTRLVSDATVDHLSYAGQLARYEADRSATQRQSVRLRLSDWQAIGLFNVGDWIYVYAPKADLVDYDNPVPVEGGTVWPQRVRVLSRRINPGNGFRAAIRLPDDSTVPLDGVQWNAATIAEIEVGDYRPEFAADPQGGAAGNQFLRYRTSTAR